MWRQIRENRADSPEISPLHLAELSDSDSEDNQIEPSRQQNCFDLKFIDALKTLLLAPVIDFPHHQYDHNINSSKKVQFKSNDNEESHLVIVHNNEDEDEVEEVEGEVEQVEGEVEQVEDEFERGYHESRIVDDKFPSPLKQPKDTSSEVQELDKKRKLPDDFECLRQSKEMKEMVEVNNSQEFVFIL